MKELIFYICGIFSCMIVWFLWAIIAYKKAKEAPLKEYARIHIDIEKAIRENEEQIELCVIDDGVGFDTSKMEEQSDGRQHIGVRNARIRFQKMCNGTVDIYSEKGKGTKIRINLPKGGQS